MKVYYFGCIGEIGHYMFSPPNKSNDGLTYKNPWGVHVDGGLCPPGGQIQGHAALHHKDGWTALSFWDRSVDSRTGSNSAFLAEGQCTFEEMLKLAREQFPQVVERFKFEITRHPN